MDLTTEAKLEKIKLLEQKIALTNGVPWKYGFKLYKWQRDFIESTSPYTILCAGNQIGKQLSDDTDIPTPSGYKKMGDLQIGDQVFGRDGKPTNIIAIPYKGIKETYLITFDDGSTIKAGAEHLWITKGPEERFGKSHSKYDQWKVINTKQIIEDGGYSPEAKSNKRKHSIPICKPVRSGMDMYDPYVIGYLLGNGHLMAKTRACVTIPGDCPDVLERFSDYKLEQHEKPIDYTIKSERLKHVLQSLGMMKKRCDQKEIPESYMRGSAETRLDLLRGLMDSDGSIYGKRTIEFSTTSEKLADQLAELVCSLGGVLSRPIIKRISGYKKNGEFIQCKDSYRVFFKMPLNPFWCEKKAKRFYPDIRYKHERLIEKIEQITPEQSTCITVDNEDGSFLATKNYIVTHNSSALYIRMLTLACEPDLWPKYFPNRRPLQFWLCQPTRDIQLQEFRTKLTKEFLPRNGFETHPQYGWTAEFKNKHIYAIHMNTGVSIYYRTYEQDISALMSGTVDAMFIDEECPWHLMPELQMRTKAPDSNAQFSISLTPVKGQEEWRQVIEVRGDGERLKEAKKLKVSVYDCQEFEDGSPSKWTTERINRMLNELGTENEKRLRIYGDFVSQEGLVLSAFQREKNVTPAIYPYKNSFWYSAVDPGGGGSGSLPGMVMLEVGNDFKSGRVRTSWRGTRGKVYTATDIMDKYIEIRAQRDMMGQYYDYSSKDFGVISERSGVGFEPADKSRDEGWALLNTLFKNEMLTIDLTPENQDLITEIVSYRHGMDKKKGTTLDHIIDALRYAVMKIPWDFTGITGERIIETKPKKLSTIDEQRMGVLEPEDLSAWSCDDDLDDFNELLEV